MNPMTINGQEINVGPATKYVLFLDGEYKATLISFDSSLPGIGECVKINGYWFEIDRFDDKHHYLLHIVEYNGSEYRLEQDSCLEIIQ